MIATLAALVSGPSAPPNVVATSSPSIVEKPGVKRRVSKAGPSGAAAARAAAPSSRPSGASVKSTVGLTGSDIGAPIVTGQPDSISATMRSKAPRKKKNPPVMIFEFAESPGKHFLFPKDALVEVTRVNLIRGQELSELTFAVYLPPYRGGRPQPMQGVVLHLVNVPSVLCQNIKDASVEKNQAIRKLEKKAAILQLPGLLPAHYHDVQLGKELAASLGRAMAPPAQVRRKPTDQKPQRKSTTGPPGGAGDPVPIDFAGETARSQAVESLEVESEPAEQTPTPPALETPDSGTGVSRDILQGETSAADTTNNSTDRPASVSIAPTNEISIIEPHPTVSVASLPSPRTVPPSVTSSPKRPPPTDLASPSKRAATRRTVNPAPKSPESHLPGLSQAVSALATGGPASRRRRSIAVSHSAPATPAGGSAATPPLAASSGSPTLPQTTNTSPRASGRGTTAGATTANAASSSASSPSTLSELRCLRCDGKDTPMWRRGPDGPKTLCNACGVKFMLGKLARSESGLWIEGKRRGELFPGGSGSGPGGAGTADG
ncbi:hypothetical protein HDU86_000406 [Geranomyces michiganensis]|nr:hypothetical protein HDU86_000406 [Geranomyces michiganensis]